MVGKEDWGKEYREEEGKGGKGNGDRRIRRKDGEKRIRRGRERGKGDRNGE